MKTREGLVGIADTRVTSGSERITARKVTIHGHSRHSMFLMTSGLRSVRDKALTYFEETIEESDETFDRLYKAVNRFGEQIRRVAREDKEALADAGLHFNLYAIVGGQLERDEEHKLYLLYPQGNWVEVGQNSPYVIIGESGYGKPVFDRILDYEASMAVALKTGFLAFDATRTSATDVDFPIDVVLYRRDSYQIIEHRYERRDLAHISKWWQQRLKDAVDQMPAAWLDDALGKTPAEQAQDEPVPQPPPTEPVNR
ncbi:MAG: hypothetical protein R3336_02365 [Phycisphaeraceae bacterium]|nr:hypothetical protein [Phycisphaeraceae bacterium]